MAFLEELRIRLFEALRNDDDVLAIWCGGSEAFGRSDALSDLDFCVMVRDGATERIARQAEGLCSSLRPVSFRFAVPQPAWHGCWQVFLRFAGEDPLHMLDLCIAEESNDKALLCNEIERHGRARVLLDRTGRFPAPPLDPAVFAERVRTAAGLAEQTIEMLVPFVGKEIRRGRGLDALNWFHALLGRVSVLARAVHDPWRYDFGLRYLHADLPAELAERMEALASGPSRDNVERKAQELLGLARELSMALRTKDLVQELRMRQG